MATPDPDAIEVAAENAADTWGELVGPLTLPIEQLVDRAGSLAAVRDGLARLFENMDVAPVTELLARASFSARLGGDASIGRESQA